MINRISVYISKSFDVYKNLATEKYLMDRVEENQMILYLWQNENTVVIGRNQNAYAECNIHFARDNNIAVARRLSGGGAVFHDLGNVNFTFICCKDNFDIKRNLDIIADACSMAGIKTELSGRNDILCDGRKFSGNAFYNSDKKAYHHGTIMVNCDLEKMQKVLTPSLEKLVSKGVKSVKSRVMNLCEINPLLTCEQMKNYLVYYFEKAFGIKAEIICDISEYDIEKTAEEYALDEYVFGKSPAFSFSVKSRFDWGSVEIMLQIKKQHIIDVAVYTDALSWRLADTIKTSLMNCKFSYDSVLQNLSGAIEEKQVLDILKLLFVTNE